MSSNFKVYKDGHGSLWAVDNIGRRSSVSPSDFNSQIRCSQIQPGEYINVKTNPYSMLDKGKLISTDLNPRKLKLDF